MLQDVLHQSTHVRSILFQGRPHLKRFLSKHPFLMLRKRLPTTPPVTDFGLNAPSNIDANTPGTLLIFINTRTTAHDDVHSRHERDQLLCHASNSFDSPYQNKCNQYGYNNTYHKIDGKCIAPVSQIIIKKC